MSGFWIVHGKSISGVEYGPEVYRNEKPTVEELYNLAFSWDGDKEVDGGGDYGSRVRLLIDHVDTIS